jgi:predicted transcriptional regulator of viral defense system
MEDALRLGEWLTEETLRVYQDHQLGREALPPIRRFLERLPEQFKTAEAKEIAEADEIPERTCEKWLTDLVGSGDLDRIRRGLYRKV